MKLLIIGHNYKPEQTGIGVVTAEFAELMAARGHQISIATTFPHYPQWQWQGRRRFIHRERAGGVSVLRMWTPLPRKRTAAWRIFFDLGFASTAFANAIFSKRPDVVVAVCPPVQVGFTAAALGAIWRVPTCLWVKDLPVDAAVDVGLLKHGSLLHRIGAGVEAAAYRRCSRIVVLHDRFTQSISKSGVTGSRLVTIPNWISDFTRAPREDAYRRRMGASRDDFMILHAGNMGAKQGLGNIVRAAALIQPDDRMRFAFMGDGAWRHALLEEVSRVAADAVTVLPLQPSADVPFFYAAADALLINQLDNVVDSVVPMKLLSYMAAGRPILAAVNAASVTAEIVRDADCGLVVKPGSPTALVDGARQLEQSDRLDEMAANAARYAKEHFAAQSAISRWEELLEDLNPHTNGSARNSRASRLGR